jgi:23S rRNA (uridine2552-2'-O)-methyltransferase
MSDQEKRSPRSKKVTLKKSRGRTVSSQRWLQRQLNDPYVQDAQRLGYRSRAAFKLIELNEKFHFLKPEMRVIDLGAAPGGWTQVIAKQVNPDLPKSQIIGIDLLEMDPIQGVTLCMGDFSKDETIEQLKAILKGPADIVLSDMAPSSTGYRQIDHLRITVLVEEAFYFAKEVLVEGGTFVAKVLQGGVDGGILNILKQSFETIKHVKPKASRKDSSEMYVVAMGFKKQLQ